MGGPPEVVGVNVGVGDDVGGKDGVEIGGGFGEGTAIVNGVEGGAIVVFKDSFMTSSRLSSVASSLSSRFWRSGMAGLVCVVPCPVSPIGAGLLLPLEVVVGT